MAYDSLKALIRQYIKTNGEQEITGQILQNVLIEMVNQYPSTDGFATQSWVTSQLAGYATTSQLADYLPLTGGTLTGNLELNNSGLQVVLSAKGKLLYTTSLSGYIIDIIEYQNDGTSIKSISRLSNDELYFTNQGVKGTSITYNSVTSGSFIKSGGTSAQFLKADGSVDSNTYITASALTGYATQSWVTTQLGDYLPLTGGTLTGNLEFFNSGAHFVLSSQGKLLYTTILDGYSINIDEYQSDGTSIKSKSKLTNDELYFTNQGVKGTSITYSSITSGSFIKSGGTSSQFLKADGSVDSNTYITSAALSGYASQSWVTTQLGDYLPLTGGTLTGNLEFFNSGVQVVLSSKGKLLFTTSLDGYSIDINEYQSDGTSIKSKSKLTNDELYFMNQGVKGTSITYSSVTSGSFIKSGGTSAQFLKADGSVDSNTYITASALTGYATQSWVTTQLGIFNPTTNFKTINNQSIIGTGNINIEGGGGGGYDAEIEYLETTGSQWIDTGIDGNSVYGIHFYFIPTGYTSDWASIISGALDNFTIGYNDRNTDRCYIRYRTAELVNSLYISTSDWNHLKLVNNVISLAGASYNVSTPVSTASGNIVIGNNSTYSRPSKIRIKSLQLFNTSSGNIVRDFIPVRVGQVGYLYDKVSGELFGNEGTGDFVLGQDTGPGGGLPYLPLTGGTITGNLRLDGTLYMIGSYKEINFSSTAYIGYGRSGLKIVNENNSDIIIGDYDDRNYTSIVNDLQGGTTDSAYTSVTQKWLIMYSGEAYFKSVSQTSDLRKKTITGDVPMNIYNVANAPLFKFTWNNEKEYSGQHIGSAAQYWQTVLPELVSIGRDADMTLAMQYDVIALASAITVAKTVVNHEERIILLERENEALKKEIADLKSA